MEREVLDWHEAEKKESTGTSTSTCVRVFELLRCNPPAPQAGALELIKTDDELLLSGALLDSENA